MTLAPCIDLPLKAEATQMIDPVTTARPAAVKIEMRASTRTILGV